MIRVVIVDDHPVVREGLAAGLADDEIEIAGTAGNIAESLAIVRRAHPDVILLDLELPDGSGIEAIPALKENSPSASIVILTAYAVEEQIDAALRAGAQGYLLKGASLNDIRGAVRAAAQGESVLDPRVAARLLSRSRGEGLPALSPREMEVLALLRDGKSNKEIGTALGVTERTAKFHVTSIMNKLGAENRTQAVAIALGRRLV